jgi:hypothetical protein
MSDSTPFGSAVTKLVIHSFSDKDYKKENKQNMFTVPINPESFTRNYKIDLDTRTGHGQPGTQPSYKASPPEDLKIDFVLDGTGTLLGYPTIYSGMSVHDQLDLFLTCTYKFDPETHRPPHLLVVWGADINFKGVLSNIDLNYTLFLPNGDPLRVKVTATVKKSETDQQRAKANSPDLTKSRQVQRGDRLDLLTFSHYNDTQYVLQVGKANNLVTIRSLIPGNTIYFPPFAQNGQ